MVKVLGEAYDFALEFIDARESIETRNALGQFDFSPRPRYYRIAVARQKPNTEIPRW